MDQVPKEMKQQLHEQLFAVERLLSATHELLQEHSTLLMKHQALRGISWIPSRFSQEINEGWLGDLQQARWELIDDGYSRWRVSLLTWGRVVLLFWSLIRVKYQI